ncbi:MAG: hypothetical protein EP346_06860 [Bacteroidetes bacterium]|nr:MAG: hypothetical protein EP346_06860 [Bacteroidota bacterium]
MKELSLQLAAMNLKINALYKSLDQDEKIAVDLLLAQSVEDAVNRYKASDLGFTNEQLEKFEKDCRFE